YGHGGGHGGAMFDDGTYTGVRQIVLSRNVGIVSLKVCYDREGQSLWGSNGGIGGFKKERVNFDTHHENLRAFNVHGTRCDKVTNILHQQREHGPYGDEQWPSFTNKMNEGKIVGFIGRQGLFLDAVGVHVMELKVPHRKPPFPPPII
ncbi:jacalin-related lectin 3-like, partial [Hibiscus syriacus]|uniref:jacalin-related lectin 3-like n=1 Tax=Hibiscus syriacus TaxID=106335 RepID=UPI00192120C6